MKVTPTSLREIRKEFPFITGLDKFGLDFKYLDEVNISKATERVMTEVPTQMKITGSKANYESGDRVFILDKSGNVLAEVEPYRVEINHLEGEEKRERGFSPLDTIVLNDLDDKVHFLLWVRYGYDLVDFRSQQTWSLTIYKPSNNPVRDMVAEESRIVRTQIRIHQAAIAA